MLFRTVLRGDREMKSDEYQDREKLGKAIIFMVKCEPYKGIEKILRVPKEIYVEYVAWEKAGESIRGWINRAKLTEALRKAGYKTQKK